MRAKWQTNIHLMFRPQENGKQNRCSLPDFNGTKVVMACVSKVKRHWVQLYHMFPTEDLDPGAFQKNTDTKTIFIIKVKFS